MSLTISLLFLFFLFPSLSLSSISELPALMALKASLDPENQLLTSWTPHSDPCSGAFEGVACNEQGHVVNISLQGKGLWGHIPAAIAGLKSLTGLYLHFNSLSGDIPKELTSLSQLTDLYLNVNNLSGEIPPGFGTMPNLQGGSFFIFGQKFNILAVWRKIVCYLLRCLCYWYFSFCCT